MADTNQEITPESVAYDATFVAPKYDEAIANRDIGALKQGAKDNIDNPASGTFLRAAKIIENNQKEFGNLVTPIDKKGGMTTPEGRMEIVTQFQTTADRPQWGTALLKYVMGDKDGAVKQITGGDIKTKITYDNDGNQIEEKFNDLGEPLSYYDRASKRFIDKDEYAKRAGGISSWANTLYGQTEAERRKQNLETTQKEDAQTNHWFALTKGQAATQRQILDILRDPKMKTDVLRDVYNKTIESLTSNMGTASSKSKSEANLSQLNDAVSKGEGFKISDTLAADLGAKGKILHVRGDRVVSTDGSFNESINNLRQKQSSESMNNEATQSANKTMASILEARRNGLLDDEGMNKLKFVVEQSQRMGREMADAEQKYGKPSFISLPATSSYVDRQANMMAQMLQNQHNAEQMMVYKNYRDNAMQGYKQANQLPSPGEVAAGYSRTGAFRELQDAYAHDIGNVLSQSFTKQAQPAQTAKPQVKGPAVPPAKVTGTTEGKPAKRSLSQIAGD